MKSKKLLFSTLLSLGCLTTYIILTSSATAQQGVMGASQVGCGSCHGSANAATTITITGMPGTGFVAGTTYPLTLKVTNASKLAAGFDMSVSLGTISNPPANTMLMGGSELHHTSPLMMASGDAIWNFSWTAPASGNSVSFFVAGNAVNNNNGDSGDQWNKVTINFNKAIPAGTQDLTETTAQLYPNPVNNSMTVMTSDEVAQASFLVISINGSIQPIAANQISQQEYRLNTSSLTPGIYILSYSIKGKIKHLSFTKN